MSPRPLDRVFVVLVALASGVASVFGHIDAEAHARRFSSIPVPNLEPAIAWLSDHRVLARVDGNDGSVDFRITDARTGEQRSAFDRRAVAGALSQRLDRAVDMATLPISRIGIKDGVVLALVEPELRAFAITEEGRNVQPFNLAEATPFLIPAGDRRVGRTGATAVRFVNHLDTDVRVFWVSGGVRYDYGTLRPGEVRRQGTSAGHKWIVVDAEGSEYGPFVAEENVAIALLDPSTRRDEPNDDEAAAAPPPNTDRWKALIEDHNILLRDIQTGETRPITVDGTAEDRYSDEFHWSHNGARLLAFRTRPAERRTVHIVESSPRDQRQPKLMSFGYAKPGDPIDHHRPVLFSNDADTGAATPIPIDNALFANPRRRFSDVHWRPDGSEVIFAYVDRTQRIARVIGLDADTGAARTLIEEAPDTFFDFAYKMDFEPIRGASEAIWMSERSGWNHLHRFDLETAEDLGPITSGSWVVRSIERVDHEAEQVWFRAMGVFPDQDPYHVHFGRVGFDGDGLTWLTRGDGTHTIDYSPGRHYLVAEYSRADLAPVRELRRVRDGALIATLSQANTDRLTAAGWQAPEIVRAKGRDGVTDIWGLIFKPTDFSPDRSYPVVEQIYAGPHGHHVPKEISRWHGGQRQVAEHGFVVVQIDGMGTNWRHKAFHDVAWKNLADAGFPDRIAWMREAAKTRPWLDVSRVGVFGGSAGGQNAMSALLHHNDFYDVAVADCGCHDNRMDKMWWNELWMGWPIDDAVYDASSNVAQAHKLEGDLMLIVGELDRNVDPASTMQVVDALIRADKDFDMLVIPSAGHGAGDTPYGRRRTIDFLVEHLIERSPKTRRR